MKQIKIFLLAFTATFTISLIHLIVFDFGLLNVWGGAIVGTVTGTVLFIYYVFMRNILK